MRIDQQTLGVLHKFKLASIFHNRMFRDYPAGGRELTFIGISKTENIEITWRDVELIGELWELSMGAGMEE